MAVEILFSFIWICFSDSILLLSSFRSLILRFAALSILRFLFLSFVTVLSSLCLIYIMFYHTQEDSCSLPWQAEALSDLCLAGSLTEKFSAKRRKLLRMFSSRYIPRGLESSVATFPLVMMMMMMKTL